MGAGCKIYEIEQVTVLRRNYVFLSLRITLIILFDGLHLSSHIHSGFTLVAEKGNVVFWESRGSARTPCGRSRALYKLRVRPVDMPFVGSQS